MMRTGHVVPLLEWAGILKALPRLDPTPNSNHFWRTRQTVDLPFALSLNPHRRFTTLILPQGHHQDVRIQTGASIWRRETRKRNRPRRLRWVDNSGRPVFVGNFLAQVEHQHLDSFGYVKLCWVFALCFNGFCSSFSLGVADEDHHRHLLPPRPISISPVSTMSRQTTNWCSQLLSYSPNLRGDRQTVCDSEPVRFCDITAIIDILRPDPNSLPCPRKADVFWDL